MAGKKLQVITKLTKTEPDKEEQAGKLNLLIRTKTFPRSYRWRESDIRLIESLTEKVNNTSPHYKVDATKIIRAALYLAEKRSPENLLKAVIESEKKVVISKFK